MCGGLTSKVTLVLTKLNNDMIVKYGKQARCVGDSFKIVLVLGFHLTIWLIIGSSELCMSNRTIYNWRDLLPRYKISQGSLQKSNSQNVGKVQKGGVHNVNVDFNIFFNFNLLILFANLMCWIPAINQGRPLQEFLPL